MDNPTFYYFVSMKLQLFKPLVVFDLETTGININSDRIVEICMIKVEIDGSEKRYTKRLNPTIPIPKQASDIHGISDEDVANAPTFAALAPEINQFIGNADFAGFNSNRFDFPLLVQEFYRAGIDFETESRKFIDAQRIFHIKEPRNLTAAYSYYCNKELNNAHSAEADTEATWEIIKAQLEKYEDLDPKVESLHQFSGQDQLVDLAGRIRKDPEGKAVFAFGKYKGQAVEDVFRKEPSYYEWMMRGDFAENTKRVITRIKLSTKTR